MVGLEAEGDDMAGLGGRPRVAAGGDERRGVAHDMVGGQHEHERLRRLRGDVRGRGRHRGPGIAARRLEQDFGGNADFLELLAHQEAIIAVGDHYRAAEYGRIGDAGDRLLQRRLRAQELEELLRQAVARSRPQARAGAAAQDHRTDRVWHGLGFRGHVR